MATSNFQTQKSFCFLLCLSFTFFLLLLNKVNSTETASFSFPSFEPNQPTLIFQNDSSVTSSGKLQLTKLVNDTPVAFRLGRALYSAPIHIWDRTTGKVASFVTSFSFVINVPKDAKSGAGMSFFLGPVNSQPRRVGPFFGLFDDENSDPSYETVAVEFDTGTNPWDPEGYHIGIDVNCIRSIKTVSWDWANGQVANVVIRYEASTKSLTASLVYPSVGTGTLVTATVDLKDVLPEWVSVGISASTGWNKNHFETHDLLSWSFESKLADGKCNALEDNAHLSSYELHDSI